VALAVTPCIGQSTTGTSSGKKAGYDDPPGFGAPFSVPGQLDEDDREKVPVVRFPAIDRGLKPWYDWKKRLNESRGLQLGLDYTTLYQRLDDSLTGEERAWSGIFRGFGKWKAVDRGTENEGTLVFGFDQRHKIGGDVTPAALGEQAGYIGQTGTKFSDIGLVLGDLNWQQRFNGGRTGLIVGRFDPNDYTAYLGYVNPFTTFGNLAILLDVSRSIPDWSWGVGVGHWFSDSWYALATVNDANGSGEELGFFEGGAEFRTIAEAGWSPSRKQRYKRKAYLSVWHTDEREDAGFESGKGILIGANWTFEDTWMVWLRGGVSDGSEPIYNESVTVGFGRAFRAWSDVLGFSTNWGAPPDDALSSQWSTELFYHLAFSENLQLTPSAQWLHDPALNDQETDVLAIGLRLRLSL